MGGRRRPLEERDARRTQAAAARAFLCAGKRARLHAAAFKDAVRAYLPL